jgi:hypothetical protein
MVAGVPHHVASILVLGYAGWNFKVLNLASVVAWLDGGKI